MGVCHPMAGRTLPDTNVTPGIRLAAWEPQMSRRGEGSRKLRPRNNAAEGPKAGNNGLLDCPKAKAAE